MIALEFTLQLINFYVAELNKTQSHRGFSLYLLKT